MTKGETIKLLTKTKDTECRNNKDYVCSDEKIIDTIYKNIVDTNTNDKIICKLSKVKKKLACVTESCVLKKAKDMNILSSKIVDNTLTKKFKIKGPRNTINLLSNFNIDDTLKIWNKEFPGFYPCEFSMIDFNKTRNNELFRISLVNLLNGKQVLRNNVDNEIVKGPFNTFGCVLNTDISSGKGKHWICLFVDMRGKQWTIEFFNSSGNAPVDCIIEWREFHRKELMKINKNTICPTPSNIKHQVDNHSCGSYVLYYIRCRLENIPYTYFLDNKINDIETLEFRKHLFREY